MQSLYAWGHQVSVGNGSELYYPQTLCKAYFNWCKANDNKPTFEMMHEFICEVQGHRSIKKDYGPKFKAIQEAINDIKSDE